MAVWTRSPGPWPSAVTSNGVDGIDTLNVDDSGTAGLDGRSHNRQRHLHVRLDGSAHLPTFSGPVTELVGFAPAPIRYFYDTIAPFGLNPRLEFLNVLGSTGDDDITVDVTTAIDTTTIDGFTGSDTITVNGDGLSAANVFSGGDDADQLVLNMTVNLGDTSFVDLTALEFAGNDPSSYGRPRRADHQRRQWRGSRPDLRLSRHARRPGYPSRWRWRTGCRRRGHSGQRAHHGIGDLCRSGADDTVAVEGTSASDDLTVAPLAAGEAMVFLGGNPWDGPDDVDPLSTLCPVWLVAAADPTCI